MEKSEIIMLVGIIVATVWLLFCIIVEGEKRKFALGIGILIDIERNTRGHRNTRSGRCYH